MMLWEFHNNSVYDQTFSVLISKAYFGGGIVTVFAVLTVQRPANWFKSRRIPAVLNCQTLTDTERPDIGLLATIVDNS